MPIVNDTQIEMGTTDVVIKKDTTSLEISENEELIQQVGSNPDTTFETKYTVDDDGKLVEKYYEVDTTDASSIGNYVKYDDGEYVHLKDEDGNDTEDFLIDYTASFVKTTDEPAGPTLAPIDDRKPGYSFDVEEIEEPETSDIIYTASFTDVDCCDWDIYIHKSGFNGVSTQLLLADSPLKITYSTDGIFKSMKYSGASITILTPNVLTELYTGKILDVYVEIYKNNELFWCGYNSPNVYNQEYLSDVDETTMECIDCLGALRYFKFGDYENGNMLFLDIIAGCLTKTFKRMPDIYYFGKMNDETRDGLNNFRCQTDNWVDENEDNSLLSDILENISDFLSVHTFQYKGNVYMVDQELGVSSTDGTLYNVADGTNATENVTLKLTNHKLEVAENSSTLSFGDVYNKINVISSIMDIDKDIMYIDPADNNKLVPIEGAQWRKRCIAGSGTNTKVREIFTTFCTRKDASGGTPSKILTYNTSHDYQPFWGRLGWYGSIIERVSTYDLTFDIKGAGENEAITPTKLDFKNNIVFRPWIIGMSSGTNAGESSALQSMKYACDNNYSNYNKFIVFRYDSEPRQFRKGDWLTISFGLSYSSQIGSGIYINTGENPSYETNTAIQPDTSNAVFSNEKHSGFGITAIIPFVTRFVLKLGDKGYLREYGKTSGWTTDDSHIDIVGQSISNNTDASQVFHPIPNNPFDKNTGAKTRGFSMQIDEDYFGPLHFEIIGAIVRPYNKSEVKSMRDNGYLGSGYRSQVRDSGDNYTESNGQLEYVHIHDLKIEHTIPNQGDNYSINLEDEDKDLQYTCTIDNDNVSECNDINLKLNTQNYNLYNKQSKSYISDGDNVLISRVLKDGVYCRPEQHIVKKYVDYYSAPKKVYSNVYKYEDILPIEIISTDYLKEKFKVGTMEIDAKYKTMSIEGYEI